MPLSIPLLMFSYDRFVFLIPGGNVPPCKRCVYCTERSGEDFQNEDTWSFPQEIFLFCAINLFLDILFWSLTMSNINIKSFKCNFLKKRKPKFKTISLLFNNFIFNSDKFYTIWFLTESTTQSTNFEPYIFLCNKWYTTSTCFTQEVVWLYGHPHLCKSKYWISY